MTPEAGNDSRWERTGLGDRAMGNGEENCLDAQYLGAPKHLG